MALQRVDLAAFMERMVVMAPMVPTSTMFTFPSTFTIRKSLAAASGVLSAGVVPDSIGVAPSGAWLAGALEACDSAWPDLSGPPHQTRRPWRGRGCGYLRRSRRPRAKPDQRNLPPRSKEHARLL